MSGPMSSPTHVVIAGTRRAWTSEQKQAILAEAKNASTTISAVARRHGLAPGLVFRWRREALDAERATGLPAQPAFVPLCLPEPVGTVSSERQQPGIIEIELASGHRLRADASIDIEMLRTLIEALVGR
jgi:transposase